MSLFVHAFIYNKDNNMEFFHQNHSEDLAGFESCRTLLYGNSISIKLGLKLLPSLANESKLFINFEDLHKLRSEVERINKNLDLYEEEGSFNREYIRKRLENIVKAIEDAQKHKGNVVIW